MAVHVGLVNNSGGENQSGPYVNETWQVVEDTGDGCAISPVRVSLLAGLPKAGQPYNPGDGCDIVNLDLQCQSVDIGEMRRDEVKGHCWREVTVRYGVDQSTPNGSRPGTPNYGQPDPVLWVPELELATVSQKRDVDMLPFVGAFTGDQYYENQDFNPPNPPINPCNIGTLSPETYQDIQNQFTIRRQGKIEQLATTANEPFNPRESLEFSDLLIRYSYYASTYDPSGKYNCYRGIGVNDAEIELEVPTWSFSMTLRKHTAKLISVIGRPGYREWKDGAGNTIERYFWKITIEIQHRHRGWYVDKLNMGTHRVLWNLNQAVDDGLGGEYDYNDDYFPGMAPITPIKGPDGQPVAAPVHLDIDGQPKRDLNAPLILRYIDGYLMDFSDPALALPLAP